MSSGMNVRKYAISILGDEFKKCSNIELATSLIAGGYVVTPKFDSLTKKRAQRLLNNLYKRKHKTVKTKKPSSPKSKAFLASWEWRTLRYEVIKEFGRRCMCCGATPDDGRTVIHVDHIKPRYKYPELALVKSNLQILCGVCNQGKGAWDETDFRSCEDEYSDEAEMEFQIALADKARTLQ